MTGPPTISEPGPELPQAVGVTATRRAAARDMGTQVAGRAFNLLLGVFVTALVARTLGDTAYGQWATILAVVGIASELTGLGLVGVAVRQAATDPQRENAWVGALISVQAAVCLAVLPFAAIALLWLSKTSEMRIAALVLLGLVALAIPNALAAIFQIKMRNGIPVGVATLNSALWAGAVGVLALTGGGLPAFAIAFLAVAVVTSAIQAVAALRLAGMRVRGTRRLWGELLRVGIPLSVGSLLIAAYARIDQVMVFEIAGAREAGLYSAAYRILDQAHFIPFSIITTLAPITAASAVADPVRLWRIIGLSSRLLMVVSVGGLAVSIVVARPLMALIFGEEFREAGAALPILVGAFVFMCFGYLAGNLVLVFRLQRRFVVFAALGLLINVGLNLALIPVYGYLAAAWATLITEVVVVVPTLAFGLRRLPRPLPLLPYARILVAGAGLAGLLLLLRSAGGGLAVQLIAAGPVYLGLLLGLGGIDADQVAAIRGALRRKVA